MLGVATLATLVGAASAKIYFQEDFNDADWNKRWVASHAKPAAERGAFAHTAGKWHGDAADKGIQTSEDARFYGISAKMAESFTNENKDLVLQFSVKWEQQIDCGGAYIKLMGDTDQEKFGGDSPYQIMFGPDICGSSNRKTHAIFHYEPKNDNLLSKESIKVESDQLSHLYTMVVHPDNKYEVMIDEEVVSSGELEKNWDFLEPREIKDPSVSKPKDWVDAKKIADPEDVKPEGYDDIAEEIPDPSAEMPEDWDEEEDGEWEAPMIPNPEYKGPWKPKMIANPDYKGEWEHPMVPNPDFKEDPNLHVRCKDCSHVGFELWQVKSGTVFDDIIVTDSLEEAKEYAKKTFFAKQAGEKEMFEEAEKERQAAEAAEREAMAAAAAEDEEGGEEEDHDEL
jgi:calreticulin